LSNLDNFFYMLLVPKCPTLIQSFSSPPNTMAELWEMHSKKKVIFWWHVQRIEKSLTIINSEKKSTNSQVCSPFNALSIYVIDLNFIRSSFARLTFTLFGSHFYIFVYSDTNTILTSPVIELTAWKLYENKKNFLTNKLVKKCLHYQFYFRANIAELSNKRLLYSLCRVTFWILYTL
jgi:hypothetical protein